MRVNIIVTTFNRINLTRICLETLLETTGPDCGVTVVDNASSDGTVPYVEAMAAKSDRITVHRLARNMGVSVAVNLGLAMVDADYHLKLDNDIELRKSGWLEEMIAIAEGNPEVGLVGYQLCFWHKTDRVILGSGHAFRKSDGCNGGCLLIPRRTHEACGFMNEDYGKYGFEDLDYGNRVLMGGQIIGYVDDDSAVKHLGAEREINCEQERMKAVTRTSVLAGEKLYLLNKLLFERGIRSRHVTRKYLPAFGPDGIRFALDEAYKPIMKLHQAVLPKFEYSTDGDLVKFDLSRFKTPAESESG